MIPRLSGPARARRQLGPRDLAVGRMSQPDRLVSASTMATPRPSSRSRVAARRSGRPGATSSTAIRTTPRARLTDAAERRVAVLHGVGGQLGDDQGRLPRQVAQTPHAERRGDEVPGGRRGRRHRAGTSRTRSCPRRRRGCRDRRAPGRRSRRAAAGCRAPRTDAPRRRARRPPATRRSRRRAGTAAGSAGGRSTGPPARGRRRPGRAPTAAATISPKARTGAPAAPGRAARRGAVEALAVERPVDQEGPQRLVRTQGR